jgi:hypothetical protein
MPIDLQTLLVATDFSEASSPATAYAFPLRLRRQSGPV